MRLWLPVRLFQRAKVMNDAEKEALYNKLMDNMQDATCKMIIAELESIREEVNLFIDALIEEKIKKYNS